METVHLLLQGLAVALNPENLLLCALGVITGTLVGALPGIGSAGACAILLPATFKLGAVGSLIMLAGIFYGTQYGGTITSVLMKVPGESASVVTMFDGNPLAKQGTGGGRPGPGSDRLFYRRDPEHHRAHALRPGAGQPGAGARPGGILFPHGPVPQPGLRIHRAVHHSRAHRHLFRADPGDGRPGYDDRAAEAHLRPAAAPRRDRVPTCGRGDVRA